MKKGFTLVELLGVIVLLGLLTIIATPPILNQIKKTKDKLSSATEQVLKIAADSFTDKHLTNYPMKDGNVYCVTLKTLVDYGELTPPIIDASSGDEINQTENVMKVEIVGNNKKISFSKITECAENR